jgi:acetate---CoA ligase (ADP-forming)
MNPKSIAIVGASERAEAIGTRIIGNLRKLGYRGLIYPVNPRYNEIAGLQCFPSLAKLPQSVDAAFLAVPAAQGPDLMDEAAACGIRAVFINANGYADGDASGVALQRRVVAVAKAHGIAVAGPNNLGLINVHDGAAIWTTSVMPALKPGPFALISQSGSIAIALAEDERDIGFCYVVTTGNEAVVTAAEYLQHFARDDRVGTILLYIETIRNPDTFAAAAQEARARGKPIVALKLGSSEGGQALVHAHTGSLAGEDRLYDAFFQKLGIIRVRDPNEMLETAVMVSAYPKPHAGSLVAVTLSGGEAALIADIGNELGLKFVPLSPATLQRLRPAFPDHATIRNPIDAWGLGFNPERFAMVLDALTSDPDIGTIVFAVDAPASGGADARFAAIMAETCASAADRPDKHFAFFNNLSGTGPNRDVRAILDRGRIPYLSGIRTALAAIGHQMRMTAPRSAIGVSAAPAGWRERTRSDSDVVRFRLLTDAGLPMAACIPVTSADAAVDACERLGYPVVLKGSAPDLAHKSDLGLVRVGLRSAKEVRSAFGDIAGVLAKHVATDSPREIYLQEMAAPGVELIVGVRNEPGFGTFVLVGVGGLFVEVMKQTSLRLGPVDESEAVAMLRETAAARLLDGVRGRGPYNIAAAARAIAALSQLGAATAGTLASIEINPLIVHEVGACGVDVLIENTGPANPGTTG